MTRSNSCLGPRAAESGTIHVSFKLVPTAVPCSKLAAKFGITTTSSQSIVAIALLHNLVTTARSKSTKPGVRTVRALGSESST
jgi:hypothetical protein